MSAQDPTTSVDIEPTDQNNLNDQEYKELDGEVKEIWRQLCMALNNTTPENLMNQGGNEPDASLQGENRRKRKQMVCKGCHLYRSHCAHGYCGSCYIREKIKAGVWTQENQRQCVNCHEMKRHYAKGLCRNCYQRVISRPHQKKRESDAQKPKEVCSECGQIKDIHCYGLCLNCYQMTPIHPKKKVEEVQQQQVTQACSSCGEHNKDIFSHGQCEACHKAKLMESEEYKNGVLRICTVCGQLKKNHCGGKCQVCYKRGRLESKEPPKKFRMCAACGQLKKIEAKGLCMQCFQRVFMRIKNVTAQEQVRKENNMRVCSACKVLKKHCCRGYCQQCYYLEVTKKKTPMKDPGVKKPTNVCWVFNAAFHQLNKGLRPQEQPSDASEVFKGLKFLPEWSASRSYEKTVIGPRGVLTDLCEEDTGSSK